MIRAIETRYKGYRFRSRLEARWAVFFDSLSIDWIYEPEGFDLGQGLWYLPDFWLPQQRFWIEIKPKYPFGIDKIKIDKLAEQVNDGDQVFALYGPIPIPTEIRADWKDINGSYYTKWDDPHVFLTQFGLYNDPYLSWIFDNYTYCAPGGWDEDYWWCSCKECGKIGLQYEGANERICGDSGGKGYGELSLPVLVALLSARSARF